MNKVLHAMTSMVSASIIFQFGQHLDAAVRMFRDAVHNTGLHLAKSRLDIKVPLLKRGILHDKQVWLQLIYSIVLS